MIREACLALCLATSFSTILAAQEIKNQAQFYLHDGDRVVFYGDSITDQRLYSLFTETYVVTRFPDLKVTFTHSGWSGDRVTGGGGGPIDTRIKRDILPYTPTVMTIMLGMNDGSYRAYDPAIFETYSKGYLHILDTVKADLPDIRFTLIKPSPYDDITNPPKFEGGYNAVLLKYADFLQKVSEDRHLLITNFNTALTEVLTKAFAIDPKLAAQIIPDRIHPSSSGALVMASTLLKTWNAPWFRM